MPLGRSTLSQYDDRGRMAREVLPDPDNGGPLTAPTTEFGYDAVGNLTSSQDALGRVTTYEYDTLNRLTVERLPLEASDSAIIDDSDSTGFATSGSGWFSVTPNTDAYNQTHLGNAPGGGATATWTFNDLGPGVYRVSATWMPFSNSPTDSPFSVSDGAEVLDTIDADQTQAPADFSADGADWSEIGRV